MAIYKTNNTAFLIGNVKIFAIGNNWSIISQILKTRALVKNLIFFSPLVFELPKNYHKIFEIILHSFEALKL